ncbi:isoleucine--tRNA ligase [Sphingobacterium mizutaii NBRC 14946 = DSM 11724]|uniref:Isoleucine--tRNA ligase n=2 Tax=Sphingobacterium mizutaii TaxID=1010 RepID=A0AAJ4X909_9SPHI|nr:isoleucine--tRNA ligase [Sphingobacterium mizutaii]GEM68441.1 isoleucine--tRNA ligase [Sphingobacterium mizutaii NBRC 14946 = DSM 11724]SDL75027.1 Isoleucyl-tRNA synthetase [Sphingobacterium mizutaii]SNV42625.1 Isoleucine--tRNA ligase [Sphingobacterium mizutaii]
MYKEYKQLNLSEIGKEVLKRWETDDIFAKSISNRPASKPYTFYEGPPSANGMPGIHHVMARTIKDIFCRYKTLKGYQVKRKGGWDTHGLPIELAVEKTLGITKEDIGKKISVKDYNDACRKEVMKYTDVWNDLTQKMGYWVDLEHPYITYQNEYIETLWFLLKDLYKKGLLYKGYTIQPYSPAAGTGLSSHELNQPGTYKDVKDTTIVAEFRLDKQQIHPMMDRLVENQDEDVAFLAWTTTPWTLPGNSALTVGKNIDYVKVKTFNQYTGTAVSVILAKNLIAKHFKADGQQVSFQDYKFGDKVIPWEIVEEFKGAEIEGLRYHQLMPYVTSEELREKAFRVILGDFVTTEDGTGIVHTSPTYGADDFRVARENGIPSIMVLDENGKEVPTVDKTGKFVKEITDFAGRFVKEEYYSNEERAEKDFRPTDVLIAIKLKEENKAFDVKKYEHTYPHCWRTDKPVLYYPLDSWFIKTTAVKEELVALNKTINWKPEATGTGRFGNWLENLVDWNLSRSRYWGTPLPIWRSEDENEEICIGSMPELKSYLEASLNSDVLTEDEKATNKSYLDKFGTDDLDLHRPYVDDIILVSDGGQKLFREPDLIDVWFDSGAMPYAQWGLDYDKLEKGEALPFKEEYFSAFPADFIAEGVDQTRGWFFTLHAISTMVRGSIAFKNVVSNGLVLDKNGNKMSKRLGNGVDPFATIDKYSADATRWYMISNAAPWDNLKFNEEGLDEVRRKFFGTLYNTYAFFALYANIDKFNYAEPEIPLKHRPEIDRWIISLLNSLSKEVDEFYADYEPTKAARAIQNFVDEHLSNWYVRLCRRRFWKGEYSQDKISAYQTLYTCLDTIAKLIAPISPFFADQLYLDLNAATGKEKYESVHLADYPVYHVELVDKELEERMALAQDISSLTLSLRKKTGINVRQPLSKILVPVLDSSFQAKVEKVKDLILSETNIKDIEFITDTTGIIKKKVKPNFKVLGAKVGKDMKMVASAIQSMDAAQIQELENQGSIQLTGTEYVISSEDVEIIAEDVEGWQVANLGRLTVALDVNISAELKDEGMARELINRIQNLRKDKGFEVTDRINVTLSQNTEIQQAVDNNFSYICTEILADSLKFDSALANGDAIEIDGENLLLSIEKI